MKRAILALSLVLSVSLVGCGGGGGGGSSTAVNPAPTQPVAIQPVAIQPGLSANPSFVDSACVDGLAANFPCANVDLQSVLAVLPGQSANDIWGWTDITSGSEYALIGLTDQTAFVDVTDSLNPVFVGFLPNDSNSPASSARDIKILGDFAFIVSESSQFGLQVFNLTRLRNVSAMPFSFSPDAHYAQFGSAHNIAVNEESGFAFVVGSDSCGGGAHMIDLADPLNPVFAGCDRSDGYTHDSQCVIYLGSDIDYLTQEICFNSNEDSLTIVNVSDKSAPELLSRTEYQNTGYTHQGWLTEDQAFFLLNDELDEVNFGLNRRTLVFDVSDLENPVLASTYVANSAAIDHNLYISGDHVFQANYLAGLSILRLGNLSLGELLEVGHFDTQPGSDSSDFDGLWSVYPFFPSGLIIASDISAGLFLLRPDLDAVPRCNDSLDNDGDSLVDFPDDNDCDSPEDTSEGG